MLVFVKHSLESPRNLKENLWDLKPRVSSWASQYDLFCMHWMVRSGTFGSHEQQGKGVESVSSSPQETDLLGHRIHRKEAP